MQSVYKPRFIFSIILLALIFTGCKKLVEVEAPVTSVNPANVYASDATAIAVLTGIYANMSASPISTGGGIPSTSLFLGLSADEFTLYSGVTATPHVLYYRNALSSAPTNGGGAEYWNTSYPIIFSCNSAIESLADSATGLTPAVRQQLAGEARFIRALCYFYLVNLYGDVPLAMSSDYTVNAALPRTPKSQVWQQIITDLKQAQTLLSANYLDGTLLKTTAERVRPSRWAATALLARAYLYTGDYVNAEAQADSVINNTGLFTLSALNSAFLKASLGNNEAIWQLQPVNAGINTQDAMMFILPSAGPSNTTQNPVYLSTNLLNSFETSDKRRTSWVDSITVSGTIYYFPYKYKVNTLNAAVTEYTMMLRLGEQYLVRAEARARQGSNLTGAAADLNLIRKRAALPPTSATSQTDLLTAIQHERQVELFTEMGHRWLDLKRTGAVDSVMTVETPQKGGGNWKTSSQWYPLPLADLLKNSSLVQNTGY